MLIAWNGMALLISLLQFLTTECGSLFSPSTFTQYQVHTLVLRSLLNAKILCALLGSNLNKHVISQCVC